MAVWKWVVGPAAGGHEIELSTAADRRATFRLQGSSEASCSLDARSVEATSVKELATDLHVLRDGVILYRGRIGAPADTLTALAHRMTVPSIDYREVLRRRLLYADSTLTFAATDQSAIAWALITDTQNRVGGRLGISRGLGQTTGKLRDRSEFKAGDSIGDRLEELAQVNDGFDFDVTPTSASALSFDVFYPERGVENGVILDYGGAWSEGTRQVDPRTYANATRTSGAETTTAQVRSSVDLVTRPEGRWDAQFGFPNITAQASLNERADSEQTGAETLTPSWTVKLRAGFWTGPGHIWLGDTVRLVAMSGRLKTDTFLRVFEIQVGIGKAGEEDVQIVLGAVRPDFARRQRQQAKRLRDLERR